MKDIGLCASTQMSPYKLLVTTRIYAFIQEEVRREMILTHMFLRDCFKL